MDQIISALEEEDSGKTLILIDEICQNTSPKEGVAVSFSLCERIANSKVAF